MSREEAVGDQHPSAIFFIEEVGWKAPIEPRAKKCRSTTVLAWSPLLLSRKRHLHTLLNLVTIVTESSMIEKKK